MSKNNMLEFQHIKVDPSLRSDDKFEKKFNTSQNGISVIEVRLRCIELHLRDSSFDSFRNQRYQSDCGQSVRKMLLYTEVSMRVGMNWE